MTQRSGPASGNTGGVSIGGGVQGGAVQTGHGNTATVAYTTVGSALDDRTEVLNALQEIHALLQNSSGPRAGTAKRETEAAIREARAEQPDKKAIGGALESALSAAKTTAEFVGAAAKLAPYVRTVADWLGAEWRHLAAGVG